MSDKTVHALAARWSLVDGGIIFHVLSRGTDPGNFHVRLSGAEAAVVDQYLHELLAAERRAGEATAAARLVGRLDALAAEVDGLAHDTWSLRK